MSCRSGLWLLMVRHERKGGKSNCNIQSQVHFVDLNSRLCRLGTGSEVGGPYNLCSVDPANMKLVDCFFEMRISPSILSQSSLA